MADNNQEFGIKVVTTADTSGVRQTDAALQELYAKQKARQDAGAAALFARIPPGGAVAPAAEKAGSDIGEHIGRGFERVAIHALGVGAILESISAIKEMAAEINKITDSLEKQGEMLVENSRHMAIQSKFAKDDADVLKIAEDALKAIAAQHKNVEEIQKRELTLSQKIADLATVGPTFGARPAQQLLDEEKAQSVELEMAARRTGIAAVRAAEQEKERVAALSEANAIERLNGLIAKQQGLQAESYAGADIPAYVEAGQAIKEYTKQRDDHTKALEKQQQAAQKAADAATPQVKAVLQNEQAAAQARAEGRERDADLYQQSADAFKQHMNPVQQQELENIRKQQEALKATPKPPEPQQYDTGTGGPSLIGPAAERARKEGIQQTGKDSATALAERMDKMIELQRQQLGIWR